MILEIDRHGDVTDAPARKRSAAGLRGNVLHMCGAHNTLVVDPDVNVEFVERDILLGRDADQIVELKPRDGEKGLAVQLRVIKTVQQMDPSGPRSRFTRRDVP